ncbi:response regulator transcription factor [Pseudoflavitalea sp. G-6-1-2]|uniref:response regulator transcription factor n=1 Tax=Pseudoflavitalea sp. G-6-1-2 TaxID=2728841 RepID=UPI00146B2D32|nr:response regulator transcription factor [Pseudoflavitalea sp. G-6-1-2]NML21639.1 response regulator transcription factor [Pseudoflavitalea sp. G-6-1-2]
MLHNTNEKIQLAIVDDHPVVIEGLQRLLNSRDYLDVAGTFTSGNAFLQHLKGNKIDIVLLDISLPDINGMELCKEIKKRSPGTSVLVLSNHSERSIIMQMLQNGASGYLLKNASADELLNCINEALNGQISFSNEIKQIIARPSAHELKEVPQLTRREKEILHLISDGLTTPQIAEKLSLSQLTIETHRRNLLQKFDVNNVAALIKVAVQQGLV